MHQRNYALQQQLNFIKTTILSRFYGIGRLPPHKQTASRLIQQKLL